MPRSTVGAILRRLGLGRLAALEPKPAPIRYERERPGELIHIDTKKLGRIDGIGHRITGDRRGQSSKRGTGWEGSVGNFVCGRAVEHQAAMALVKRSPKRTAN